MSRPPPDPVYILRGARNSVSSLKFQSNDMLYSGHLDGQVHVWSMKSHRTSLTVPAHPGFSCLWIEFPDDNQMVTQGRDGSMKRWSSSESDWIETASAKTSDMGFCRGCLMTRKMVAVPSRTQSAVDLYDLDLMKVTAKLKPDSDMNKFGMCMSIKSTERVGDDSKLLVGYEDGSIALWDIRSNRLVDSCRLHKDSIMCLEYSPIHSIGYSGSVDESLFSWKTDSDKIVLKDSVSIVNPGVSDVIARDDGKIVVFAGWDCKIRVFGAKHLKVLAVLDYHRESVHCVTFSKDNMLACGSKDQLISLWDIYR